MRFIFGPVPSRRLGRSLGIDPTVRADGGKACNWNCVYCQLGRTHTFTGSRETLSPSAEVLHELDGALAGEAGKNVDWITFVGSGEPTLSADLGEMLRGVKAMTPLPVAVITNGSLLSLPGVRNDLMVADAVMPTLDAGDELTFLRINRPHPQFGFTRHIDGLVDFRREYHGKIWLETMLISGLNDDEGSLTRLAKAIEKIAPDEVHLVLPTRPPVETWVRPSDSEGVLRARAILSGVAKVVHPDQAYGDFSFNADSDPLEAAVKTLARHPMSDDELRRSLILWGENDPDALLRTLIKTGRVHQIHRYDKVFWLGTIPDKEMGATHE